MPTMPFGFRGTTSAGTPTLSVSPSSLDVTTGVQTYTLTGSNLTANVSITQSDTTHFEVSLNGSTFASSQSVTPSGGSVSQTVYVRTKGVVGANTDTVSNSSTGATTRTVTVTSTTGGGGGGGP